MDKKTLQTEILEKKYNSENWLEVLKDYLGAKNFLSKKVAIDQIKANEEIESAWEIGSFSTIDERIIGFYEVYLSNKSQVQRKRVGYRNLFKNIIANDVDAALIVFVQGDKWRFSFVSEIRTEEGKKETEPKRYTYLFGEGESCRTAADRFDKLRGKALYLKDLFEAFSVETLTKEFYKELFDWYQWAQSENIGITFPNDVSTTNDDRIISEHLIRLITRLMFVWFIKRKDLIPESVFDIDKLSELLNNFKPLDYKQDSFYRAILQNLFFATLNKRIEEREFANDSTYNENKEHYGIKTLYRYSDEFKIDQQQVLRLFSEVPFLNGGLFECLDKEKPDSNGKIVYSDGFSRRKDRQSRAFVPNIVFFDEQKGLLNILKRYNFTIEENSPHEIQVALDPELLGKVFENLLGTFNPETKETARKLSGSFYTPREIVEYMVNESLIAYLINKEGESFENDIKDFVNNTEISENLSKIKFRISNALREIKVIDPACGSGAFPMGLLNKMVDLLSKLENHETDLYDLKLHLIENCIYGIDIQTIAVQISKLRFFISLIINQDKDSSKDNFGILPLPNLETKFVAANTLINLKKNDIQLNLFEDPEVEKTKIELFKIRHNHFSAANSKDKKKYRQEDERLRDKLAGLFEQNESYSNQEARLLSSWNPYDQNASSPFFDSEWMFNIKDGFDVVIGNPPYVAFQRMEIDTKKALQNLKYKTFENTGDIYAIFYERGQQLLRDRGILSFITSRQWMQASYGKSLRKFLATETNPIQLIDFGQAKIFEGATVFVNILLFEKAKNKNSLWACSIPTNYDVEHGNLTKYFSENKQILNKPTESIWSVSNTQHLNEIIEKIGKPLMKWKNVEFYAGIKTGLNEAYHINESKRNELISLDNKSNDVIKPLLRGKDIKRYGYDYANLYTLFIPWHFPLHNDKTIANSSDTAEKAFVNQYPAVYNHLSQFKNELSNRNQTETGIRYEWYSLQRYGADFWENYEKQKIVWIEISDRANYAYDDKGMYLTNSAYFLTCKDDKVSLKYLLAVLNSKVADFYFSQKTARIAGGRMRYTKQYVEQIPVPEISLEEQKPFIAMADKILTLKPQGKDTNDLEQQIDNLIYKLYELTYEEVMVIEPEIGQRMSREEYERMGVE
jgi:hypothetical protein